MSRDRPWTSSRRALVVGDVMLDVVTEGPVLRLSPEAAVPVVLQQQRRHTAGGAGNAAMNLAELGDSVSVIAVVGDDLEGCTLRSLLDDHGVDTAALVTTPGATTVKHRVVSDGRHLLRLDAEDPSLVGPDVVNACREQVRRLVPSVDVVLISDYAKGVCAPDVCEEVIGQARRAGIPVVVDPKGADYLRYRGATVITPNLDELAKVTVRGSVPERALDLMNRLVCAVLVTQGADGMSLFTAEGSPPAHLATQARTVLDVTGAGDTVASVLAACLARGISMDDACRIANACAGVVVERPGTTCIGREEWLSIGDVALKSSTASATRAIPLESGAANPERSCG